MMRELVTLYTKQYVEYWLSILNNRPEVLHNIHKFVILALNNEESCNSPFKNNTGSFDSLL